MSTAVAIKKEKKEKTQKSFFSFRRKKITKDFVTKVSKCEEEYKSDVKAIITASQDDRSDIPNNTFNIAPEIAPEITWNTIIPQRDNNTENSPKTYLEEQAIAWSYIDTSANPFFIEAEDFLSPGSHQMYTQDTEQIQYYKGISPVSENTNDAHQYSMIDEQSYEEWSARKILKI